MKKLIIASIGILMAGAASAAFIGDSHTISTVAEALKMRDDTMVTLEGNIQKRLYKDKYLFADKTGEITVEIEREDWRGIDVTPQDTIQIRGEIDKDWFSTEVDVDSVKIVK